MSGSALAPAGGGLPHNNLQPVPDGQLLHRAAGRVPAERVTVDDTTSSGADAAIALRPIRPDDRSFLLAVYASTREPELAAVPWDAAQKAAFVEMQFDAPARPLPGALRGRGVRRHPRRRPAGRAALRRARSRRNPHRRHRAAARFLQPRHRDDAAARTAIRGGGRRQAAAHPRRTLQSRAAALPAARVPADRRSRGLSVHGVEGVGTRTRGEILQPAGRALVAQERRAIDEPSPDLDRAERPANPTGNEQVRRKAIGFLLGASGLRC